MRGLWRAAAAPMAMMLVCAGCGGAERADVPAASASSQPSSSASVPPEQPDLWPGAVAETDPLAVLRGGVYTVLRRAGTDPVRLAGYRALTMPDAATAATQTFTPADGGWQLEPYNQLVYSPSAKAWVTDDRTQRVSAGPEGTRGWPTVKSQAAYGVTYSTYSSIELSGRPLPDGFDRGWSEAAAFPDSAVQATFSAGARSFVETVTAVDPTYLINRIHNKDTNADEVIPAFACGDPDFRNPCATVASDFRDLQSRFGWYSNTTGTGRLTFRAKGDALFTVKGSPDTDLLDVRIVTDDGPPRVTLTARDPKVAEKFESVFHTSLDHFALYVYEGQVVAGAVQPAGTTRTDIAGYNRVAIDDLLTHWTPALPPVNP